MFLSINVNFCTCVLTFAVKLDNKKQRYKGKLLVSLQQTTHFFLVTIVTRTVSSLYTYSVCVFYLCFCVCTCSHVGVYV